MTTSDHAVDPFRARGLPHNVAAQYLGLTKAAFDEEVKAGRLPPPIYPQRRPQVWDRVAIDEALDLRISRKPLWPRK